MSEAHKDAEREAREIADQLAEMSDRITRFSNFEGDAVCARAAQLLRTFADRECGSMLSWAVDRWNAEVKNRPLINVHRRALDDTWRQVIRHCGGDPDALLGPDHSRLMELAK